eukprot:5306951-Ditylum_brightwellii.AAC.1
MLLTVTPRVLQVDHAVVFWLGVVDASGGGARHCWNDTISKIKAKGSADISTPHPFVMSR